MIKGLFFSILSLIILLAGCDQNEIQTSNNTDEKEQTELEEEVDANTETENGEGKETLQELSIETVLDTGNAIYSSPVVVDDIIYFGTVDGTVYAVDSISNETVWTYATDKSIRSRPAVNGDTLYVVGEGVLFAIDRTNGEELWHFGNEQTEKLERKDDWDYTDAAPVIVDDRIYFVGQNGYLRGVSSAGELEWEYQAETNESIRSTPIVEENIIYFADFDGKVYAIDMDGNELIWTFKAGLSPVTTNLVKHGDMLFFGGRSTQVFGVDAKTGEEAWYYTDGARSWITSEAVPVGDKVYIGSSDSTRVYEFESETGELGRIFQSVQNIFAKPIFIGDHLYILDGDAYSEPGTGMLSVYDLTKEAKSEFGEASAELVVQQQIGGNIIANPVVHNGHIYAGSVDGTLYKIATFE